MQLNDFGNFGIRGFAVNGFSLANSVINGTNGTPNNSNEGSVYFGDIGTNGLSGTSSIINSEISGGSGRNFSDMQTSAGLAHLTVTNTTFGLNQANAGSSFVVEARANAAINVTVTGSTFTGAPGDLANFTGQTGSVMNVIFDNNTLSNNHSGNIIGGGGLTIATAGSLIFDVSGNTFRDANGSAITLQKGNVGTLLSGTVNNNTIGVSGVADSGSKAGNGIFLSSAGTGTVTLAVTNNTIQGIHGNAGIYMDNTGGSYTVNATITGNIIRQPGAGSFAGLVLTNGANASGDTVNVFANISGNDFSDGTIPPGNGGFADIVIVQSGAANGHTFTLSGAAAANLTDSVAIQNFLKSTNNASALTSVEVYSDNGAVVPGTFAASSGLPPQPVAPTP
jgi:hypothetical protein